MPVPPWSGAVPNPRHRSPMTRRSSAALCDRIWAAGRTAGRVVDGDLEEAIRELGLRPALAIDGGPIRRISRWVDGRLLTFVANPRR